MNIYVIREFRNMLYLEFYIFPTLYQMISAVEVELELTMDDVVVKTEKEHGSLIIVPKELIDETI